MAQNSSFHVKRAAVLGAGVMGAQIAAHLVNAGVEAVLFELAAQEGDPNANVRQALDGLKKLDPAPFASESRMKYIIPANYDQHLHLLKDCDLVIEAIAERMDWKRDLYQKITPHIGPHAIVGSNTSGLSINTLAQALPETLRRRFCGIHFFNPPRYMHLVELIPCSASDPVLLDQVERFLVTTLGKGVVRAKDTPNFIANRVGIFSMLATMRHADRYNLGFDVVDALTGPAIGRPKSATFRTADVVGLDTLAHVVKTMRDTLPNDPWHRYFELPVWLNKLIEKGALGQKTRAGVYRKQGAEIQVMDIEGKDYRPSTGKADDAIKDLLKTRDPAAKFAALRASTDPQAKFLWAIFRDCFHYCAYHLSEIADTARDVDFAIRWGFGWDRGPFETWQAAGWSQVASWIGEDIAKGEAMADVPLPHWAREHGRKGVHGAAGSYSPAENTYKPRSSLPVYKRQLVPPRLIGEEASPGVTVFENDAVRMWHTGDDIAIVSFKTKMHAIGDTVLDGILQAIDEAERHFAGLVIWQPEPPFSAGADLLKLMQAVQGGSGGGLKAKLHRTTQRVKFTIGGGGRFSEIWQAARGTGPKVEEVVAQFQFTTQRLKYSMVPTVAALNGLTLGGGCEFAMHCDRAVAALESYVGLVEAGVGLIPAGGGCKELALRAAAEAKESNLLAFIERYFRMVAMATVAKSAEQAKEAGLLRASDVVVMNEHELLYVAKSEARALAERGYRPPLKPKDIPVAGKTGIATLKVALANMREGGHISAHDYEVASRIASALCGGEVEAGSLVDEDWLLNLERAAFMDLLGTEKTVARIEHMLKTGKPLRN